MVVCLSNDGKVSGDHFVRTSFGDRGVQRNVQSRFRLHPHITDSEASILIEFMIKSARELVVEPPMTVGLTLAFIFLFLVFVTLHCSHAKKKVGKGDRDALHNTQSGKSICSAFHGPKSCPRGAECQHQHICAHCFGSRSFDKCTSYTKM